MFALSNVPVNIAQHGPPGPRSGIPSKWGISAFKKPTRLNSNVVAENGYKIIFCFQNRCKCPKSTSDRFGTKFNPLRPVKTWDFVLRSWSGF